MNTYETTTTTTTTTATTVSIGPNIAYAKSLRGLIKLATILLSILAFICASVYPSYAAAGLGWVQFVTIVTFICFTILFVLRFMNIYGRIPAPMIVIEFCYFLGACFCLLIAGIVAAVWGHVPALGAAAFFTFATLAVAAVETFFLYRDYQASKSAAGTANIGTVESTTTTTYETHPQY